LAVEETLRVICAEQQVEAVSEKDFLRRKVSPSYARQRTARYVPGSERAPRQDELVEELLPLVKEIEPVRSASARCNAPSAQITYLSTQP